MSNAMTVAVTPDEVTLIINALHTYVSDFGHDEGEILHRTKQLIANLGEQTKALNGPCEDLSSYPGPK